MEPGVGMLGLALNRLGERGLRRDGVALAQHDAEQDPCLGALGISRERVATTCLGASGVAAFPGVAGVAQRDLCGLFVGAGHFEIVRSFQRVRKPPASKSALTRPTTLDQSRGRACRNSRSVGYQGLSARPSCQRQSGANGSRTQAGRASAPARCAILVSTVMMRSSSAISAAVSTSGLPPGSGHDAIGAPGVVADLRRRAALLQRKPGDPGHGEQRRKCRGAQSTDCDRSDARDCPPSRGRP